MWSKISKIRGKYVAHHPPLLVNESGNLTDDPHETSELFADAFASVSREENYNKKFINYKKN